MLALSMETLVSPCSRIWVRLMAASSGSQTFPIPSLSTSAWSGFGVFGQLSSASQMPSPSESPPPPAMHVPPWQVSAIEQVSPLLQTVPFGTGVATQVPVGSLQVPTLHWLVRPLQLGGVPAWHVPVGMLQLSPPLHASPSLQSEFWVQRTQGGGAVRNGVKSMLPVAVSHPPVFGPVTQPHQLFSALTVVVVGLSAPTVFPLMLLLWAVTVGMLASPVSSSNSFTPVPVPVMRLQVRVPAELPPLPLNETASTPKFPPWMSFRLTAALPSSRTMPSNRFPCTVLPWIVELSAKL